MNTRGTVAAVAVQGLDMVAQVAVGVIVARGLGVAAMGAFAFAYAVAGVLSIFLLFGNAEIAIPLYASGAAPAELVLGASLRRLARGAVGVTLAAAALLFMLQVPPLTAAASALAVLALLANGLSATANAAILGLGLSAREVPAVVVTRALLVSMALWGAAAGSLATVLLGAVLAAGLLAAGRLAVLQRHGGLTRRAFRAALGEAAALEHTLRRRSRPVGLSSVFGMISSRADTFFLQKLADTQTVGHYGAAYRIISGVVAGTNALVVALYPRLSSADPRVAAQARRAFVLLPGLAVAVLGLASLFAGELLMALYGPAFAPATPLFRVLLIAACVQVVLCFLSRHVVASGHERLMPWAQAAAAAVNVATNLALIPTSGGLGAALATLAAESTALVVYVFALRRSRAEQATPLAVTP